MVTDPTVGKYMVGCLTNLTESVKQQEIHIIIKLYITQICTLWLFEWWLSCGQMYVTRTVYKHSDITYSSQV